MARATRRVGGYLVAATLVIGAYALLYQAGMSVLEGESRTFLESLLVVVETLTTTGYGEDAETWSTTGMWVLMIVMQLTGIALFFLTLPLFVVPLIEDALTTEPPTSIDLEDHVVVARFTPRGEELVDELDDRGVPHVILEPDRDLARDLYEQGYTTVHGDPESVDTLRGASIEDALALVADGDDEANASIVLSAKEAAPEVRIVSMVEDTAVGDYHRYAGADRVVSPRRMLGERLASKVITSLAAQLGDAVGMGNDLAIVELLVHRDSPLVGQTLAESDIGETGVNVIGAWFHGRFDSPPSPDAVIDEHTVMLVAGHEDQLAELKGLTLTPPRNRNRGPTIVAGHGEVGTATNDALASADVDTLVVDLEDDPGVDQVGDITDPDTLDDVDVQDARSIILALNDDTATVFATLVLEHVAPEVEIIARANETESVSKLYRAGAEYVLALSTVSGRLLAADLLDEDVVSPETRIEVVEPTADELVDRTLAEADVRARTDCTVIAVERDGELISDVPPTFRVRESDDLIVAGTAENLDTFRELFA